MLDWALPILMAAGPMSNFLETGHRTLFSLIIQSSETSQRLGLEVLRVSGSPRDHIAKLLYYFYYFHTFMVIFASNLGCFHLTSKKKINLIELNDNELIKYLNIQFNSILFHFISFLAPTRSSISSVPHSVTHSLPN